MNKLGQCFLKNKNTILDIVKAIDIKPNDIIFEIGSGHGELTEEIIKTTKDKKGIRIICIEKDSLLLKKLEERIKDNTNVNFINGDALKELPKLISEEIKNKNNNYKIVGNIPYYITGYIFRIISELEKKPSVVVFMIQKEVAEKIVSNKMSKLSANIHFWAKSKIIEKVPKEFFKPQPNVDSAVIKLEKIKDISKKEIYLYDRAIKSFFLQPRKTILNNISSLKMMNGEKQNKEEIINSLNKININPNDRPQNLSIDDIKNMADLFLN